jgi:hypothetical protein
MFYMCRPRSHKKGRPSLLGGKILTLQAGQLLLFRADMVHSGWLHSKNVGDDISLHFYIIKPLFLGEDVATIPVAMDDWYFNIESEYFQKNYADLYQRYKRKKITNEQVKQILVKRLAHA